MSGNSVASIASIIVFVLLLFYIIGGSYIEKKKFIVGHETGVAIIIGFMISLVIKLSGRADVESSF
jgi:hypothetical protein